LCGQFVCFFDRAVDEVQLGHAMIAEHLGKLARHRSDPTSATL